MIYTCMPITAEHGLRRFLPPRFQPLGSPTFFLRGKPQLRANRPVDRNLFCWSFANTMKIGTLYTLVRAAAPVGSAPPPRGPVPRRGDCPRVPGPLRPAQGTARAPPGSQPVLAHRSLTLFFTPERGIWVSVRYLVHKPPPASLLMKAVTSEFGTCEDIWTSSYSK